MDTFRENGGARYGDGRQGAYDVGATARRVAGIEREVFAQNLLRWGASGQGQTTLSAGIAIGAEQPPALTLNAIIRAAGARSTMSDSDHLSAVARGARANGLSRAADVSFYTQTPIMNLISHAIEERMIAERRHADLYAGFQRMALVRPQLRRYQALAQVARFVYLFGIPDARGDDEVMTFGPQTTLRFIIRPEAQTRMEYFWFVVLDDPEIPTALLAQHTEGDLWAPHQVARSFTGIWTFDPVIVQEIIQGLRQAARVLHYGPRTA